MDDQTTPQTPRPTLKLPEVDSIDGVNQNFTAVTEFMEWYVDKSDKDHQRTNDYITRIAEEANRNFADLGKDIKSILTSHTMVINFGIIALGLIALLVKEGYDTVIHIIQLFNT